MSRSFDRVMVAMHIGSHPKFARLTNSELLCFITGVLPVAQQSLFRGRLLVGDQHATPEDISAQTGRRVSPAAVRKTLHKLIEVGALVEDDETGALRVHDFEQWNPAPRVDRTNADRQRRYRERRNASRNAVTNGPVTPPEVEEEKTPPNPPGGGGVRFAGKAVPKQRVTLATELLTVFNAEAGTRYGAWTASGKPSENLKRIIGALTNHPDVEPATAAAAIRYELRRPDPYWDVPHTGVVFGPKAFERILAAVERNGAPAATNGASFIDRINSRREAA